MTSWLIALLTAVGFAFLAVRAGRGWIGWAVGGGLMGLTVTVLVFGLADAPFIPFSDADQARHDFWSVVFAVAVVVVISWFATMDLHQHHQGFRLLCGLFCSRQSTPPSQPSGSTVDKPPRAHNPDRGR